MSMDVLLSSRAQDQYEKLDGTVRRRVKEALLKLASGARGLDIKMLKGTKGREDLFRLRVGDYRIVYVPDKKDGAIKVIRIEH